MHANGATPADTTQRKLGVQHQMAAAGLGAFITSLCVTPLDVLKVRLQVQQEAPATREATKFSGAFDGLRKLVQADGFRSLWRGLNPTLINQLPATVIYFSAYEQLRERLVGGKYESFSPLIAGGLSRTLVGLVISPLELVRTNLQAQGGVINGVEIRYKGVIDVLRCVRRHRGITGWWAGLSPSLIRDVPFSAIYWGIYESMHAYSLKRYPNLSNTTQFALNFSSGATAGAVAAVITMPFDVLKTTIQVHSALADKDEYSGVRSAVRAIVRDEGWGAFMKGAGPRTLKAAPACAIMISVYELFKQWMSDA